MRRVLFVCVENSCRSQIAEAFAHIHGKGIIEAFSSGSSPSGKVSEKAIASMGEVDYDLSQHKSKPLREIPDIMYDLVVAMGCGDKCPFVRAKQRQDWNIPDPKNLDKEQFRKIRELIESKVLNFINEKKGV